MERIELFDNYVNNQLSDAQRLEFDECLKTDKDFASDFKVYLLTVKGISREAEQDNLDFGMAMKHLSKDQLYEIIGRKKNTISREDVINRLQPRIFLSSAQRAELSGAAALNDIDDDEYTDDIQEVCSTPTDNDRNKDSDNSLRLFTFIFIAIVILLIPILISILL